MTRRKEIHINNPRNYEAMLDMWLGIKSGGRAALPDLLIFLAWMVSGKLWIWVSYLRYGFGGDFGGLADVAEIVGGGQVVVIGFAGFDGAVLEGVCFQ